MSFINKIICNVFFHLCVMTPFMFVGDTSDDEMLSDETSYCHANDDGERQDSIEVLLKVL